MNITEGEMPKVAAFICGLNPLPRIIILRGEVGSGKTTLVKQLLKQLDSEDDVSSPTFSIINEYKTRKGEIIYHSDWYRVKDVSELQDAGIEDYLFGNNMLIIEWPEIGEILFDGLPHLEIDIEYQGYFRNYRIKTMNITGEKSM